MTISDEVYNLITTRHSCQKFQDKEVLDDDIIKIINCGLSAPSAMNKQPWFFVIVKDKKILNKLNNLAKESFNHSGELWRENWAEQTNFSPFYNPNILILVCNKKNVNYSKNDCCFAVQNMTMNCESKDYFLLKNLFVNQLKLIETQYHLNKTLIK